MATEYNIVRREVVERAWECARCGARGVVTVPAVGESGWRRRSWWSSGAGESRAHEDARWAVQRDAERIMSLMRCPTCGERAPRATLWAVVRAVPYAIAGLIGASVLGTVVVGAWRLPFVLAPLLAPAGVWVATWEERRRWKTARHAVVANLKPGPIEKRLPVAVARPPRAAPRREPARLEPLPSAAPEPTERASDAEGPRFLKGE